MTPDLLNANNRVLIVDDQDAIHEDFAEMLSPTGRMPAGDALAGALPGANAAAPVVPTLELLHANSGEEACSIIQGSREEKRPIAVAYVHVRMPAGIDGIETIRRVRKIDRDVEIVIMTAYTDRSLPEIVSGLALLDKLLYIRKPLVHEEIQQTTLSLVRKWNVEQEQRQLASSYRRMEAALDATGDAIAMFDGAGRVVFANRIYRNLLGLKDGMLQQIPPGALAALIEERLRDPDPSEVEARFLIDNGNGAEAADTGHMPEQRLFHRATAPVHDRAGVEIGCLEVYRDVSKDIRAEQTKAEVLHLCGELETGYSFAGLLGAGPRMRQVSALLLRAAESDITVLVRGEPGTGKHLVSRSFHLNSLRKQGPFVTVDCDAVPDALLESELFGHEGGALAGSTTQHLGAFERTEGGTILLDNIDKMPCALQRKLLRVLQDRTIQRVGGDALIRVDVRVITATDQDLERAVMAGEFREDLFYRLAAFPIVLPPLRERRQDVPVLAHHFLERHAARAGKSVTGISHLAMRSLLQYDWPGNERELERTIARAAQVEPTEVLQAGSLPLWLSPIIAAPDGGTASAVVPLESIERQALSVALEAAGRNAQEAARALGISRSTLYRKLKRHGLTP